MNLTSIAIHVEVLVHLQQRKRQGSKRLVRSPRRGSVPRPTTDWPIWSAVTRLLLLLLWTLIGRY